jgi:hypothetical protein
LHATEDVARSEWRPIFLHFQVWRSYFGPNTFKIDVVISLVQHVIFGVAVFWILLHYVLFVLFSVQNALRSWLGIYAAGVEILCIVTDVWWTHAFRKINWSKFSNVFLGQPEDSTLLRRLAHTIRLLFLACALVFLMIRFQSYKSNFLDLELFG